MATVPGSAYVVTDLPFLLGRGDGDNIPDVFVSKALDRSISVVNQTVSLLLSVPVTYGGPMSPFKT